MKLHPAKSVSVRFLHVGADLRLVCHPCQANARMNLLHVLVLSFPPLLEHLDTPEPSHAAAPNYSSGTRPSRSPDDDYLWRRRCM